MSLVKLLGVKPKRGRRPEARGQLTERLNQLLSVRGNRERLTRMGFPDRSLDGWRVRDLAMATHHLEHLADSERSGMDLTDALAGEDLDEGTAARALIGEIIHEAEAEEQALITTLRKCELSGEFPDRMRSEEFWEVALAVNAAFKGLLASQGQSGHICAKTIPVSVELPVESGWPAVVATIVQALEGKIRNGDVVVVADKVVAAAQGRIGPREVLLEPDPKTIPVEELPELATRWEKQLGFPVTPIHLLLADEFQANRSTLGASDHNTVCVELAAAIASRLGVKVDVIISDTDTGLDTRRPLIGTLTIAATPLGATRALTLYEAMRCATAAEFTRGHTLRVPVVICVPAERRRRRAGIGEPRGYSGTLDRTREPRISHA